MITIQGKAITSMILVCIVSSVSGCWDSNRLPGKDDEAANSDGLDSANTSDSDTISDVDTETVIDTNIDSDSDTGLGEACDWANENILCDKGVYEGNVSVANRADLESLAGYTAIDGRLHIGCPDCPNLCPLTCLETISDFTIGEVKTLGGGINMLLENLDGLEHLTHIESLTLKDNPKLDRIDALAGLTAIEHLTVVRNPVLKNFKGLHNVQSLAGSALIRYNDGLENLHGLESLGRIGGNLSVYGNHSMVDLQGLKSLTELGGALEIGVCGEGEDMASYTNDSLKSLVGLDNLGSAWSINIGPNPELPYCEVCGLLEHLDIADRELVCQGGREDECWVEDTFQCP